LSYEVAIHPAGGRIAFRQPDEQLPGYSGLSW